jgi:hypothetical protein
MSFVCGNHSIRPAARRFRWRFLLRSESGVMIASARGRSGAENDHSVSDFRRGSGGRSTNRGELRGACGPGANQAI